MPLDIAELPCPNQDDCQSVGDFSALDPQPAKAFRMSNAASRPLANSKCNRCQTQFSEHFLIRCLFNFKNNQLPADKRLSAMPTTLFDPPRGDDRETLSRDAQQFETGEEGEQDSNLFGTPLIVFVVDL